MRAVITVLGKDMVGILAKVTAICAENGVNVTDVSQSIMQDLFAMIMLIDLKDSKIPFDQLSDKFAALAKQEGLTIHIMHEDIFNSMHRI
jgi:ACT domain-containing protein